MNPTTFADLSIALAVFAILMRLLDRPRASALIGLGSGIASVIDRVRAIRREADHARR